MGAGFRGAGGGSVCGGCVAAGRDVWWAALACLGCLTVTRVCAGRWRVALAVLMQLHRLCRSGVVSTACAALRTRGYGLCHTRVQPSTGARVRPETSRLALACPRSLS